eukprot:gnl/Chilomastix_caulleri/1800.p4 GENE.gnl/Chilomastix_caulleri/1800~~gnl/Chilomastix_caulleri/1800.p4  ORF type:complete len:53 (+),score=16.41 gnl/Chilomastix_caulleri/1800:392-550(+)
MADRWLLKMRLNHFVDGMQDGRSLYLKTHNSTNNKSGKKDIENDGDRWVESG